MLRISRSIGLRTQPTPVGRDVVFIAAGLEATAAPYLAAGVAVTASYDELRGRHGAAGFGDRTTARTLRAPSVRLRAGAAWDRYCAA